MTRIPAFTATVLLALGAAAVADPSSQDVNLDGSVGAHSAKNATLAASVARQLGANAVPSKLLRPGDLKTQADADIDSRKRPVTPHLKAERENLKGADARAALARRQQSPANYDRAIQMGDMDHTEQVTDLKVFVQK